MNEHHEPAGERFASPAIKELLHQTFGAEHQQLTELVLYALEASDRIDAFFDRLERPLAAPDAPKQADRAATNQPSSSAPAPAPPSPEADAASSLADVLLVDDADDANDADEGVEGASTAPVPQRHSEATAPIPRSLGPSRPRPVVDRDRAFHVLAAELRAEQPFF